MPLLKAVVRAASAASVNAVASPSTPLSNLVVVRAMLPGVLSTFVSLWVKKVRLGVYPIALLSNLNAMRGEGYYSSHCSMPR